MRRPLHSLAALLPLLMAACATGPSASTAPATPAPAAGSGIENTAFAPSLGINLRAMTRTPTGLYYRDLEPGTGPEALAGQYVAIHYTGWLADGTEFDSNQPGQQPLVFRVGAREVVPGFDQGVAGMRVGGRRQLVIPPALGYGSAGIGPIPGNAILIFNVQVVAVR